MRLNNRLKYYNRNDRFINVKTADPGARRDKILSCDSIPKEVFDDKKSNLVKRLSNFNNNQIG